MARKRRIEYPGATFHVISRRNYRKELFVEQGSGSSFEATLIETVERCGWEVYAYLVMSNHFHLAVRTPEANLVAGMRWLRGVFATRFNRYRGERGHVFQGCYKSLLVEEDQPLSGLINYITLNPVRAGLCTVGERGAWQRVRMTWRRIEREPRGRRRSQGSLRRDTTAGNPWIAKRLRMGHPSRVSNLIREVKLGKEGFRGLNFDNRMQRRAKILKFYVRPLPAVPSLGGSNQ